MSQRPERRRSQRSPKQQRCPARRRSGSGLALLRCSQLSRYRPPPAAVSVDRRPQRSRTGNFCAMTAARAAHARCCRIDLRRRRTGRSGRGRAAWRALVMTPRLKAGACPSGSGSTVQPSRDHGKHDSSPARDVPGGVDICRSRVPACSADELGLRAPVGLLAVPAHGARPARITRVNGDDRDTGQCCLVLDKRAELRERPALVPVALSLPDRGPRPDPRQFFDGDLALRVLGFLNNLFADDMILVTAEPLLKPTYGYLLSRFFVPPKRRCATTPTSTPARATAAHAENIAATTTKTTPTATAFQTTAFEGAIPQSNT